jgi:hypothetical protein
MKINPLTGRTIKENGPLYNKFIDKCRKYSKKSMNTSTSSETQTEQFSNNVPSFFIGNRPEIPLDQFDFYEQSRSNKENNENNSNSVIPRINSNSSKSINGNLKNITNNLHNVISSEFNGIEISVVPQASIQFGNGNNIKTFKVSDYAIISNTGDKGRITNIGPKYILLDRGNGLKQRRMKHTEFVILNSQ